MADKEYDFILVGGGTAGLVVATRLSEDPNVQILVVEAGENRMDDPRVKIPALYETLKGTDASWNLESEIQVSCVAEMLILAELT